MTKQQLYIILVVAIGVIIWLSTQVMNKNSQIEELEGLNEAAASELQIWKDKDGYNRGRIDALETESTKTFLAFQTQDTLIRELQAQVKTMDKYLKKQGSVTIIEGETKYDTIYQKTQGKTYQSFFTDYITDSINNNWLSSRFGFKFDSIPGTNQFKIDSTLFSLKVKNKYSLTIGREPTGFLGLGKGKPFADIKNYNPYTSTTALRTYQVALPPPKRFGVGPVIAYGLGPNMQFGWFVGIGGTWTLIRF
jgi:hypothetical protein